MDTNSNLEQINTFQGGMNTDVADFLIDSQLYRYAENLRFLTQGNNNTGELKIIDGYTKLLDLPEGEIVLKTGSIRNYGIIITGNADRTGWKIYTIDENNISKGFKCIFGPCLLKIGDSISIVTRWETDKLINLYIADGLNALMRINILHDDYVDGMPPSDIKYLNSLENIQLSPITAEEIDSYLGHFDGFVIQYTYILYKEGGQRTDLAPLSLPIYLYNDEEGYKKEDVVNSAIRISMFNNYSYFDKICIYRILYSDSDTTPDIYLIYDDYLQQSAAALGYEDDGTQTITTDKLYLIDTGSYIEQVSIDTILLYSTRDKVIPGIIESKGNYLFYADIKDLLDEVEELFENLIFDSDDPKSCVKIELADDTGSDRIWYRLNKFGTVTSGNSTGNHVRSLMPGETYRYGIILYDNLGRKTNVKWVKDLYVPENQNTILVYNAGEYLVTPLGIRVTVKDIPNCSGYEIVRCIRGVNESNTVYQGIVGFASHILNTACLPFCLSLNLQTRGVEDLSAHDLLLFTCPEYCYLPEDTKDKFPDNASLDLVNHYIIRDTTYNVEGEPSNSYKVIGDSLDENHKEYGVKMMSGLVYMNGRDGAYLGEATKAGDSYAEEISGRYVYTSFSYIYPAAEENPSDFYFPGGEYDIQSHKFIDSIRPEDLLIDKDKNFLGTQTSSVAISKYTYNNTTLERYLTDDGIIDINHGWTDLLKLSGGGKFILLGTNENIHGRKIDDDIQQFGISVANIRNKNNKGYGIKLNSVYRSFGNYINYNGNTQSNLIYDGDTYINVFVFNHSHVIQQEFFNQHCDAVIYAVPLHSKIDLSATYGDIYPRLSGSYKYMFLDYKGSVFSYTQEKDAYLYNTAYSAIGFIPYIALTKLKTDTDLFDTRIKYAGPKENGEKFDSWITTLSSDTMDVDTRYGRITELKLFKDYLMFWLENAVGIVSSNERNIIQDVDGSQLLLGNGDVMQRYDYITTEYGMRPGDFSDVLSNTTLYWWDGYKKDIIGYSGGRESIPFKKLKNISNYINTNETSDNPCLMYDDKYSEVLFNVVGNYPIVYNELSLNFTSIYTTPLANYIAFKEYNIVFDKDSMYKWNYRGETLIPKLEYIVNKYNTVVKTFDISKLGLGDEYQHPYTNSHYNNLYNGDIKLPNLNFKFYTKEQHTKQNVHITSREYDYRFTIPRAAKYYVPGDRIPWYGNRMRGKTMLCKLEEISGDTSFSIQYVITKFRISYS